MPRVAKSEGMLGLTFALRAHPSTRQVGTVCSALRAAPSRPFFLFFFRFALPEARSKSGLSQRMKSVTYVSERL